MKREIQISRKTINGIVLLVVVIVLIGAGFLLVHRNPALLSRIFTQTVATPTQVDPKSAPDAQAAAKALTAFYTLDYTEPVDQWQDRVCALTTQGGCQIIQAFFAPAVRKVVDANQVKTGCTVQAVRLVEDKGDTRTWLLEVTLDKPWPGEKPTRRYTLRSPRPTGTGYSTASCLTRRQPPASPLLHRASPKRRRLPIGGISHETHPDISCLIFTCSPSQPRSWPSHKTRRSIRTACGAKWWIKTATSATTT